MKDMKNMKDMKEGRIIEKEEIRNSAYLTN